MWPICTEQRKSFNLYKIPLVTFDILRAESVHFKSVFPALTVDNKIKRRSHGADRVADPTLVGAVVGAVDGLYEHGFVARGEADSVIWTEGLAVHHPLSRADGAGGLAAEVGGASIFYQDGCKAADGGSGYQHCTETIQSEIKRSTKEGERMQNKGYECNSQILIIYVVLLSIS